MFHIHLQFRRLIESSEEKEKKEEKEEDEEKAETIKKRYAWINQ